MKAISVRNISDRLYEDLREMAKANQRSMQEQIRYLLTRDVEMAKTPCVTSARRWRKRLSGRKHTDSAALIREDRNR